jgi:hypothetical protein
MIYLCKISVANANNQQFFRIFLSACQMVIGEQTAGSTTTRKPANHEYLAILAINQAQNYKIFAIQHCSQTTTYMEKNQRHLANNALLIEFDSVEAKLVREPIAGFAVRFHSLEISVMSKHCYRIIHLLEKLSAITCIRYQAREIFVHFATPNAVINASRLFSNL